MALITYLFLGPLFALVLVSPVLISLLPLLSSRSVVKLRFSPNQLSKTQITFVIGLLWLKSLLRLLRLVPDLQIAHASSSAHQNDDGVKDSSIVGFQLPDMSLEMPVLVSREDVKRYNRAVLVTISQPRTSNEASVFLLAAVTTPLMLLLLARPSCPILPLGSVNVRNRFEFLLPQMCKQAMSNALQARASLSTDGRRVKRGVEFDVVIEVYDANSEAVVFRQFVTILQFLKQTAKPIWRDPVQKDTDELQQPSEIVFQPATDAALNVGQEAPTKWAAICKDYNPIHVSKVAAKLFGFPGRVAHGNLVVAMAVEALASAQQTLANKMWANSDKPFFLEAAFKRPMIVPLKLQIIAEKALQGRVHFQLERNDKIYVEGRLGWIPS